VLSVPLDMAFHVDVHGRPRFGMKLGWLFGLVSKEVGKGKRVAEAKPKRRRRIGAWTIFEILRTKGLLAQLKRLLKDVLGRLKIRDIGVDFRVGLDSPADTGLLFALIGPATLFLGSSRVHVMRLEPSFGDEAVCEGYLHGVVRLQPVQLVLPFIRFAFSLATIRAMKKLVLIKWRGKN